jgi:hypothetical protein
VEPGGPVRRHQIDRRGGHRPAGPVKSIVLTVADENLAARFFHLLSTTE